MKLSEDQAAALGMYEPQTYCIALGEIGRELEQMNLVEWMPAPAWAGQRNYAITDAGRAALAAHKSGGEK